MSAGLAHRGAPLARQAHDFAPDLLTLQESPPSALPRQALLLVATLVAALIAWAIWARLDIVATAPGRLVPSTFTKVVQPAEPGVVTAILVKDGDAVQAGDVLLRLDSRLSQADTAGLQTEVELRGLSILRMDAELSDRPLVLPADATPALAAQVRAQYAARRGSYEDALAQEQAGLARSRAEFASAQQTLSKLAETVPIAQAAAESNDALAKDGYVPRVAADDRRREYIEKRQELQAQRETVNALKAALAQQERKLEAVRSTYRTQLQSDRLDTLAQLNRVKQERDKAGIHAGQLEVRSSADGIVKDLAVTAPGAVVQAGASLLTIVPRGEDLQAEVLLNNEDAGFVGVGQKVRLKVAAYPFQKYGLLEGSVSQVAADATQQKDSQQTLTYRALIRLSQQVLASAAQEKLALAPGMLVTAEINQGERSVLEYLLSPVQKVAAQAGRER